MTARPTDHERAIRDAGLNLVRALSRASSLAAELWLLPKDEDAAASHAYAEACKRARLELMPLRDELSRTLAERRKAVLGVPPRA
ncbi:MAG: hypothetical protein ACK5ZO_11010 [Gemmatimonas sp.]|jgi:hypothetical protein|uniref:hypothetical protein n=1 Tax=Gemmatimonas sp. TaxID=1962908 RepID=UPI00391EFB29